MKNKIFILYVTIALSVSLHAEVQISVLGYGENEMRDISVSTDERGNRNYIYVDKGSRIVDSTIGSTIIVNHKFTKEEGIAHYKRKINHYEDKLNKYNNKINYYYNKISEKPRKREYYQAKIDKYQAKIEEYKKKIIKAEAKLQEYQEMK